MSNARTSTRHIGLLLFDARVVEIPGSVDVGLPRRCGWAIDLLRRYVPLKAVEEEVFTVLAQHFHHAGGGAAFPDAALDDAAR